MVIYFILNNFNFKLNLIKCLQHDIDNFLQMSVCLLSRLFIYVIVENVNAPTNKYKTNRIKLVKLCL